MYRCPDGLVVVNEERDRHRSSSLGGVASTVGTYLHHHCTNTRK